MFYIILNNTVKISVFLKGNFLCTFSWLMVYFFLLAKIWITLIFKSWEQKKTPKKTNSKHSQPQMSSIGVIISGTQRICVKTATFLLNEETWSLFLLKWEKKGKLKTERWSDLEKVEPHHHYISYLSCLLCVF